MPSPLDIPKQRAPAAVAATRPSSPRSLAAVKSALYLAMEQAVRTRRMEGASWSVVAHELGQPKTTVMRQWRHVDDYAVALVLGPDGAAFRCKTTGVTVDPRDPSQGVLEHLAHHIRDDPAALTP